MPTPVQIKKYLDSRGVDGPWQICGAAGDKFAGAVVIPSLAENENLPATLFSLARNPLELLSRFLVLVVVNHRADADPADKEDNFRLLNRLEQGNDFPRTISLAWVDAASPGKELPARGGGVGLARKIGFDLALPRLDHGRGDRLLVALDADTLVRPDYLPALVNHFRTATCGGAVIPFLHREGHLPRNDDAIRRYELFLRCYVQGLARAGSPYAFHTVGSAMACTAGAYVKAGGMNTRTAGEDFYFLQQLQRTSGVDRVEGTVVYPSARASHRVPFGTGRSVGRLLSEGDEAVLFYRAECFQTLGEWLALVAEFIDRPGREIHARSADISGHLHGYLDGIGFPEVWEKLRRTSRDIAGLSAAFHGWFDGLKSMKLIHHLSAGPYPRSQPEEAVPALLRWAGLESSTGIRHQLALLRKVQIGFFS